MSQSVEVGDIKPVEVGDIEPVQVGDMKVDTRMSPAACTHEE